MHLVLFLHAFFLTFLAGVFTLSPHVVVAQPSMPALIQGLEDTGSVVARIYFAGRDDLNRLAGNLDIWEVYHKDGFLVASLRLDQYGDLLQRGYRIEIDEEKTGQFRLPTQSFPDQLHAIPGYPCYRSVEETYASMRSLGALYPNLVSLLDIGDSWDKMTFGGTAGYDLHVMVLGNRSKVYGDHVC